MKKITSYLSLATLLAITSFGLMPTKVSAQYSVSTFLLSSNMVTNLFPVGGITVKRVTVSASGTQPAFYFFDYNTNGSLPLAGLQYSNTTAFSNLVTVDPYTNSVIFTNSLNQTATNKYIGRYHYWTNVATATASNALQIGAMAIQGGVPYTLDVNWIITQGLTVRGTNNANPVIIVEYQ